jgi:hypothetical protein
MCGAIPPLPQYVFMAWCLVKHMNNFTFTVRYFHYFNRLYAVHSSHLNCPVLSFAPLISLSLVTCLLKDPSCSSKDYSLIPLTPTITDYPKKIYVYEDLYQFLIRSFALF